MKNLIEILEIMDRYHATIGAEHDVLLFWSPLTNMEIPNNDLEKLNNLGVFYSSDYDCLAYFV